MSGNHSSPRVQLDLYKARQEGCRKLAESHTPKSIVNHTNVDQESDLPAAEELKQPQVLEAALTAIMVRFAQADRRQRDAIDREVMNCARLARMLIADKEKAGLYMRENWAAYWNKHKNDPKMALKFVFKKAHGDPKKASFYFRATYKMFEDNVDVETWPQLITDAGGYQALAKQNKRFMRAQTPEKPGVRGPAAGPPAGQAPVKTEAAVDGVQVQTGEGRSVVTSAPEESPKEPLQMFATFERKGNLFPELPAGTNVCVILRIVEASPGKRVIHIFHAAKA